MPYSERLHGMKAGGLVAFCRMHTLKNLRLLHGAILVLDAASMEVQVGLLRANERDSWSRMRADAGQGIFACMEQLGNPLKAVDAFIYCEGPGSILGIRTAAAAIRTWQAIRQRPAYHYRSLDLVAHALAPNRRSVRVIADARRESWHVVEIGAVGTVMPIARIPQSHQSTGDSVTPEHFRTWAKLPPGTQVVDYDLPRLLAATMTVPLLMESSAPDAFSHEQPRYATWSPAIHRAPS